MLSAVPMTRSFEPVPMSVSPFGIGVNLLF